MHVRKFEADTIDGALKEVKRELGPDAIILKTVTNKGVKGAFKKSKIEVTAAISEKDYVKKAKVDQTLTAPQKEEFYSGSSSYISNMIDRHDGSSQNSRFDVKNNGYGKMALNKPVQQVKEIGQKVKSGLDEFLSLGGSDEVAPLQTGREISIPEEREAPRQEIYTQPVQQPISVPTPAPSISEELVSSKELSAARDKIDLLEKQIFELATVVQRFETKEPVGIYQLRSNLRALDINEDYLRNLSKKALFELSDEEVQDADTVFEFALREMLAEINTDMPLFSETMQGRPVVSVLLSESSCGQTSMSYKMSGFKKNMVIVRKKSKIYEDTNNFAEQMLGIDCRSVESIGEVVSECRKCVENGQDVIVDYQINTEEMDETKKFIDGLRRSFQDVEVFISLSAIHSELYNKKMIGRYKNLADGLVVSHLDQCLNYGALFNISIETPSLPIKFFGTGEEVPKDVEVASAERILAGVFQL
jgi:flagellar biosynthesis GTPase FlhF